MAAAAWGEIESLRILLQDRSRTVRLNTLGAISRLSPNPELAEELWDRLPSCRDVEACETATAATLLFPTLSSSKLCVLLDDPGVEERVAEQAITLLHEAGKADVLHQYLPLLTTPPRVTWNIHRALLEAAVDFRWELPASSCQEMLQADEFLIQALLLQLGSV